MLLTTYLTLLSESFTSGIFQSAITIFVFLLGVPILIDQTFIPEDLRKFSHYLTERVFKKILICIVYLFCIYAIGILLEMFRENDVISFLLEILLIIFFIIFFGYAFILFRTHITEDEGARSRITSSIVDRIVESFDEKIYFSNDITFDKALKNEFETIIELGSLSKPGFEKQIVIKEFNKILDYIFDSPVLINTLKQELIEIIINYFSMVLVENKKEYCDEKNFNTCCVQLKKLIRYTKRYPERNNPLRNIEYITLEMGKKILGNRSESSFLELMKVIEEIPDNSDTYYKLGIEGLKKGHNDLFVILLPQLILNIKEHQVNAIDLTLGLLAHHYHQGDAVKSHCRNFLEKAGLFPLSKQTIENAKVYFYQGADFETVDKLGAMADYLKNNLNSSIIS